MPFDSKLFLAFSLAVVAIHHCRAIPWSIRRLALLGFSYSFYASWSPSYLPFLLFSTVVDWEVSRRLEAARSGRGVLLAISVALNLGLLAYFKYASFLTGLLSPEGTAGEVGFVPLGISFFTFQTMSYTIDVYRGRIRACSKLTDFALFVSFFPQLVSGPVVRAEEFLPQLKHPPRPGRIAWGLAGFLIVLGLVQKTVIADGLLGPLVTRLYESTAALSPTRLDHIVGIYAFWGQLYADFAGYSNLALGLALCLGIVLPANFRCPHAATSVAEFWQRWHITLTGWFRDYVYRPLGGNRGGPVRAARNVLIVMFLVGLWHGAAWTFVVWGVLNAALLLGERALGGQRWHRRVPPLARALVVFLLVGQTCALFRAHDLAHALSLYHGVLVGPLRAAPMFSPSDIVTWASTLVGLFAVQWWMRDRDLRTTLEAYHWSTRALLLTVMLTALWALGGDRNAYIYFDF